MGLYINHSKWYHIGITYRKFTKPRRMSESSTNPCFGVVYTLYMFKQSFNPSGNPVYNVFNYSYLLWLLARCSCLSTRRQCVRPTLAEWIRQSAQDESRRIYARRRCWCTVLSFVVELEVVAIKRIIPHRVPFHHRVSVRRRCRLHPFHFIIDRPQVLAARQHQRRRQLEVQLQQQDALLVVDGRPPVRRLRIRRCFDGQRWPRRRRWTGNSARWKPTGYKWGELRVDLIYIWICIIFKLPRLWRKWFYIQTLNILRYICLL